MNFVIWCYSRWMRFHTKEEQAKNEMILHVQYRNATSKPTTVFENKIIPGGTTYHLSTAGHNISRGGTKHHKADVTIGVRATDVLCAALFLLVVTITAVTAFAQFSMTRCRLTAMH